MEALSRVSGLEEMENGGNGPGPIRAGSPEIIELIDFILLTFKPCHIQSYNWKDYRCSIVTVCLAVIVLD